MIATLGGILEGDDEDTVEKILEGVIDQAGSFYRYSMSGALLGSTRKEEK
jgi:hypothetical protein